MTAQSVTSTIFEHEGKFCDRDATLALNAIMAHIYPGLNKFGENKNRRFTKPTFPKFKERPKVQESGLLSGLKFKILTMAP
mmetsp:Transcript_20750/g.38603  ORF Transcript_20750/g.38603 Transcript_20750/m.38603 type:complete len:81 (+) Transcript_20750:184-426(+)